MNIRKIMAYIMTLTVMAVSFSGCSFKTDTPLIGKIVGLKSNEIFKVDELICTKPEYMLVLMNMENQYKNDFGGNIDWNTKIKGETTLQDYVMEKVKEDVSIKYTLSAMAETKGIELTEKETEKIVKAASTYYDSLTPEEKEYTGADVTDVEKIYTNYFLAEKLYAHTTENIGAKISDEEARVIKIQYIRMNSKKTQESKIRLTLENVTDLVNGGYQLFSREAKQYSEDNTFEKVIKKNDTLATYEKEAFSLNSTEMSNIIQDGDDYYLVYCVESYIKNETEKNKQSIINKEKSDYFIKQYNEFLENAETDFNTKAVKKITLSEEQNVNNATLIKVYDTIKKK